MDYTSKREIRDLSYATKGSVEPCADFTVSYWKMQGRRGKGHGSLAEGWLCMQKFQVQFQSLEENALSRKDGEEY